MTSTLVETWNWFQACSVLSICRLSSPSSYRRTRSQRSRSDSAISSLAAGQPARRRRKHFSVIVAGCLINIFGSSVDQVSERRGRGGGGGGGLMASLPTTFLASQTFLGTTAGRRLSVLRPNATFSTSIRGAFGAWALDSLVLWFLAVSGSALFMSWFRCPEFCNASCLWWDFVHEEWEDKVYGSCGQPAPGRFGDKDGRPALCCGGFPG